MTKLSIFYFFVLYVSLNSVKCFENKILTAGKIAEYDEVLRITLFAISGQDIKNILEILNYQLKPREILC